MAFLAETLTTETLVHGLHVLAGRDPDLGEILHTLGPRRYGRANQAFRPCFILFWNNKYRWLRRGPPLTAYARRSIR